MCVVCVCLCNYILINYTTILVNVCYFVFSASLRLGGEKLTYGDHVIVVGDAAGN